MLISDIYGMEIITNTGRRIGSVEDIIIDFEKGGVSNLLLAKMEEVAREENVRRAIMKQSVGYDKVRNVSNTTIIVSSMTQMPTAEEV